MPRATEKKAAPDRPAKIDTYEDRPFSKAVDKDAASKHYDYRPDGKPVEESATEQAAAAAGEG